MINIDIYAAIILIMKRGQDKLCHLLGIYTVHQKMVISCVYMDFITYEEGGGHATRDCLDKSIWTSEYSLTISVKSSVQPRLFLRGILSSKNISRRAEAKDS